MSDNPIELIVFFDSIERMFGELEVPNALRVILLKPYLSERAAMLVNRLTGDVASDYKYVKKYLLEQFRLCPQYFLETFNRVQRAPNETYRAFVSRLSRLLQHYLRSRCVQDFDTVCQLLIADRVKTSLNETVLKHVLNAESTGDSKWLRPDALSDVLDTYYANFQVNDRPRASAIGVTAPRAQTPVNNSPYNIARMGRGQGRGQSNDSGDGKPPVVAANVSGFTSNAPLSLQSTGNKPIRRCYICSSPSHLALKCPSRNKEGATGGRGASNSLGASSPGGVPRYGRTWIGRGGAVNSVAADNETSVKIVGNEYTSAGGGDDNLHAQCSKVNILMHDDNVCNTTARTGDPYNKPSPVLLSNIAGIYSTDVRTGDPHKTSPTLSNNIAGVPFKLAELHYIDVDVFGANYFWKSLLDSGTEVDCINRNKLIQMSVPHTIVGDIALRPMAGPSIPAQLVKIKVRISSDREQPNRSDFVEIVAAAFDDLDYETIPSRSTVEPLIGSWYSHVNLFDEGVTN